MDPVPELRHRPFGVIVVALLQLGTVAIALGLAVAAVVIAANVSMRTFARHSAAQKDHRD